jgi:hypothetical protein
VEHIQPRCHRSAGGEDDGRGCNLTLESKTDEEQQHSDNV